MIIPVKAGVIDLCFKVIHVFLSFYMLLARKQMHWKNNLKKIKRPARQLKKNKIQQSVKVEALG